MSKWGFRKKIDERGIVMRNKARMVAQGHTQEEGIDYDEVFLPVAMIKAIRLFLAYASFKDFMVYQMDVKSAFLYEKIEKEVYVCQPTGFEDLDFLDKVYKVEKALYRLHQAPRACHDKYVAENLKKYGFFEVKTVSTPMKTQKPLLKDEDGEECKKQTVVENFTTEAEYVVASSCCGQVLWIQNQLLDYRDFTNPVKVISLPQDVLSTFDRHLIELENQVQRLMKAHLAPKQPVQVNKISSSCKIYSGPHDTQYCMENPK
nr:copia protein [Tanacetum cinerariifolium]